MTIAALQQAFNEKFPNLCLSFFTKPHGVFQSSPVKYLITEYNLLLERIQRHLGNVELDIYPEMTVAELEQKFEQDLGLHVQVQRKTGHTWEETMLTDCLSLRAQNEMAVSAQGRLMPSSNPDEDHNCRTEWYLG